MRVDVGARGPRVFGLRTGVGVGGHVTLTGVLVWLSIVAAMALPLFAVTGRAGADGGHLTPAERSIWNSFQPTVCHTRMQARCS